MKTQRALLAAFIIALILIIVLVSVKEYYVAIAVAVGALIIGHREVWHLIKRKKLPPIDERVRENIARSTRNGFIFFAVASASMMLFFTINLTYVVSHDPVHIMSGIFLAGGLVYLLSYIFYDRAEPKLDERELTRLRTFLQVAGIAAGAFIISFILHNAISAVLGLEEPVFFIIAVILSPGAMAVGLIGSLIIFIKGLARKRLPETSEE